jgi:hypothetical protein
MNTQNNTTAEFFTAENGNVYPVISHNIDERFMNMPGMYKAAGVYFFSDCIKLCTITGDLKSIISI